MDLVYFLLFGLSLLCRRTTGLKCYTCSVTEVDIDQRCVTDPGSVPGGGVLDCSRTHCISVRVEHVDPKGVVSSMFRNCVDNPPFSDSVVENGPARIYYRACQRDLCNGGNGKGGSGDGSFVGDTGATGNLLVPGTQHHSIALTLVPKLFMVTIFICTTVILM